jgi:hypothetical protein
VVVHILKADLEGVVVGVGQGPFGFHPSCPYGFVLEKSHLAGGVMDQRLIDFDADFLPGRQAPRNQVRG